MIDERDLLSLLEAHKEDSETWEENIGAYLGEADGRERQGYSKIVTREIMETVETIVPYLMKLFFSGDEVVRFEPEGEEDIDLAQQETDYVNWVFLRKNRGFCIGETVIRDALLNRVGAAKVYFEESEKQERTVFRNKTPEEITLLAQDGSLEFVEVTEQEDGSVDAVAMTVSRDSGTRIEPIPPSELRLSKGAKSIEDAAYVAHVTIMTKSEIEFLGFEIDPQLANQSTTLSTYRRDDISRAGKPVGRNSDVLRAVDGSSYDDSLETYEISEAYIKADSDGDGYAELRQVIYSGKQVFSNQEVDSVNIALWTPIMLPHQLKGLSEIDIIKDLQEIKTALTRNLLDNQYNLNNGRHVVLRNQVNLDELANSKPGGWVTEDIGGALRTLDTPNFGANSMDMLSLIDQAVERRTGVNSRMSGVDPNMLGANQAASAVSQVMTAAEQRLELMARRFGEDFLVPVFRMIHDVGVKHESQAVKFRLNEEFTEVSPGDWKQRYDMRVVVGLGNGNKNEKMFHLQQIFAAQQTIIAGGGLDVITSPKNIWALQEDVVKLVDKTARNRYFMDPDKAKPKEPAEPGVAEQLAVRKAEFDEMVETEKLRIESEKLELERERIDLERDKLEAQTTLKAREITLEAEIEREQGRPVAIGAS